jgi:hypothetical protein
MTAGKLPQSAYVARRRLLKDRGEWQPWTPAGPVRDHIRSIRGATGMSLTEYAAHAGVHRGTIRKLLAGPAGNPDVILTATATALLAVTMATARPNLALTGAAGTRRRLQALAVLGWTLTEIAARAHLSAFALQQVRSGHRATVERGTAVSVAAVYGELWLTPAPGHSRGQVISVAKTCLQAARQGWVTGAAWDDIDDPACRPQGTRPELRAASR